MTDITANRLLSLLADIESALPALAAQPAVREIGSQVASGAAFGSRPPGDLSVLELVWSASNQAVLPKLLSWAVMIAEERRDLGSDDGGPADGELPAVCAYLRQRIGFVVTQPWADELEAEWSDMRAQLRRAPGSPLYREVIERTRCLSVIHDVAGGRDCPGTIETRVRDHGAGVEVTSRCRTCGRVYDDQAMALARAEQDEQLNLVTAEEAVARLFKHGLTVTEPQIRQWSTRGALARREFRGQRRTYDLIEVARLARRAPVNSDTRRDRRRRSVTPAPTDAP